ncbi:MAG: hypothetical protein ACO24B_01610 [Ilumatobacteraceae bacterium]
MEQIKISKEIASAILGYLQTRPYIEVYQLIDALLKAAASPTEEASAKPEE